MIGAWRLHCISSIIFRSFGCFLFCESISSLYNSIFSISIDKINRTCQPFCHAFWSKPSVSTLSKFSLVQSSYFKKRDVLRLTLSSNSFANLFGNHGLPQILRMYKLQKETCQDKPQRTTVNNCFHISNFCMSTKKSRGKSSLPQQLSGDCQLCSFYIQNKWLIIRLNQQPGTCLSLLDKVIHG